MVRHGVQPAYTWFEEARGWIDYLRRSHFLLQQGTSVADVAYYLGDDAPKMTGTREPALPAGYSFDYIDGHSLPRLKVENGRLVLPSGASYRLLVLPPEDSMRPELITCLRMLVEQGGTILGPKPSRSPSMQDYPACDQTVRATAAELWQDTDGINKTMVKLGKGQILWGQSVAEALDRLHTLPDARGTDDTLPYAHRHGSDFDLYYLSNQSDRPRTVTPEFRVTGRQAEVWDAVSNTHVEVPQQSTDAEHTAVSLKFAARQSLFVIFQKSVGTAPAAIIEPKPLLSLDGPWSVTFPASSGLDRPVSFATLTDWTQNADDRIRYFSGKATYRKTFLLPAAAQPHQVLLDLGSLNGIAHARLNGHDVGIIWCAPGQIDLTSALAPGENTLEIDVTNNWANRLIGDQQIPADKRQTWTSLPNPVKKNTPLQPSGLTGLVTLISR